LRACRSFLHHFIIHHVLLLQTAVNITTLADACNRSDVTMVKLLLSDPRTDPFMGSDEVPLPLQYAVRAGALHIVRLFEDAGFLTPQQEAVLLATASKYERSDIAEHIDNYFLSQRTLSDLPPREKVYKLWQEFQKQDVDNSMFLEKMELRVFASALGTPLTEPELVEAQKALDTDGDGTITFDELCAFWLADAPSAEMAEVVAAVDEVLTRHRLEMEAEREVEAGGRQRDME
jgi:hypothetical protein